MGKPEALVADAGYHSKENVERCVEQGIEPYIAGFFAEKATIRHWKSVMKAAPECPAAARGGCGDGDEAALADG